MGFTHGAYFFREFLESFRCHALRIFGVGDQQDVSFRKLLLHLDLEDVSGGEFAVGEGFRDEPDPSVVAHGGQNQVGGGQLHVR